MEMRILNRKFLNDNENFQNSFISTLIGKSGYSLTITDCNDKIRIHDDICLNGVNKLKILRDEINALLSVVERRDAFNKKCLKSTYSDRESAVLDFQKIKELFPEESKSIKIVKLKSCYKFRFK